jgi:hypothetical protein
MCWQAAIIKETLFSRNPAVMETECLVKPMLADQKAAIDPRPAECAGSLFANIRSDVALNRIGRC